jgi:epoxyqueuosine reductase
MSVDALLPFRGLAANGLNLQAVFNLAQLPADVIASLALSDDERARYTQLLLVGHGGRRMWEAVQARGMHGGDPIDAFAREQVEQLFEPDGALAGHSFRIVFPGSLAVGLQRLGELAGWHHAAPFRLGVNRTWGSWFAYRAVAVADTALPLTRRMEDASPCDDCKARPCTTACPVAAVGENYDLNACLDHRKQPGSSCAERCLARNACPVGAENRYTEAQTSYHYLRSLADIRKYG